MIELEIIVLLGICVSISLAIGYSVAIFFKFVLNLYGIDDPADSVKLFIFLWPVVPLILIFMAVSKLTSKR